MHNFMKCSFKITLPYHISFFVLYRLIIFSKFVKYYILLTPFERKNMLYVKKIGK